MDSGMWCGVVCEIMIHNVDTMCDTQGGFKVSVLNRPHARRG